MTFEDLFSKVEEANTILRPMVEREITVTVEFNGVDTVEFKNYSLFTLWVNNNFSSLFATGIYNLDLGKLKPLTRIVIGGGKYQLSFEIIVMLNVCDIK